MKDWPPQPGLTVMQRTRSAMPRSSETASTGVPGLIATPARQPSSRIARRVRLACGVASSWKVIESAPALANSAIWRSGASIIRCTSTAPPAAWTWSAIAAEDQRPDRDRRHEMAVHHVEVDHPRPGVHHLLDLRAEPARSRPRGSTAPPAAPRSARASARSWRQPTERSERDAQAARSIERAAGLALHVLGVAHPRDRLVFAAVGALGDEFEAAEAVDAAQPAGQLGRAQPGLAAVRAGRPSERRRRPPNSASSDSLIA